MKNNYKIVVEVEEFKQKILDYISSGEVEKMIDNTVFAEKPECRSAVVHGMAIASMLASSCRLMAIEIVEKENENLKDAD